MSYGCNARRPGVAILARPCRRCVQAGGGVDAGERERLLPRLCLGGVEILCARHCESSFHWKYTGRRRVASSKNLVREVKWDELALVAEGA